MTKTYKGQKQALLEQYQEARKTSEYPHLYDLLIESLLEYGLDPTKEEYQVDLPETIAREAGPSDEPYPSHGISPTEIRYVRKAIEISREQSGVEMAFPMKK